MIFQKFRKKSLKLSLRNIILHLRNFFLKVTINRGCHTGQIKKGDEIGVSNDHDA